MQGRQKVLLCAFGCFVVSQSIWSAEIDEILPLPQWSEFDTSQSQGASSRLLESPLFPENLLTGIEQDLEIRTAVQPRALTTNLQAPGADMDLSLFLPDELLGKTISVYQQPHPTPTASLRFLDSDFLTFCRESPPDEHLIDPDSHVSETQKEDLLRFLQFHAHDARIKAYVVVTDHDQAVPSADDLSDFASGSLSSQDSCLAVYPLGEPWRARLFLSASIHKVTSPDFLISVVDDCAKDAALVTDPLEQLHRFTVRLSIRLFWLEKMIGSDQFTLAQATKENIPLDLIARREAALAAALLEDEAPSLQSSVQWWSVVLGVLLSLAGGCITRAFFHYRRRRLLDYVWVLPEFDAPIRLGGDYSGGGGAWIQYR